MGKRIRPSAQEIIKLGRVRVRRTDKVEIGSKSPGEGVGKIDKGALPLSIADSRDPKGNVDGNALGVRSGLLEVTNGLAPTRV